MKERQHFVALDDYEHGIVIDSLNEKRKDLISEGKTTDAVDELIVKVGRTADGVDAFGRALLDERRRIIASSRSGPLGHCVVRAVFPVVLVLGCVKERS